MPVALSTSTTASAVAASVIYHTSHVASTPTCNWRELAAHGTQVEVCHVGGEIADEELNALEVGGRRGLR